MKEEIENIDFLYVEDNEDYSNIILRVIQKEAIGLKPLILKDGSSTLDFLNQFSKSYKNKVPKFILLDLKMSGINGFDLLKEIRNNQATKNVPVIMFTSSEMPDDVKKAYALGANAYIIKPEGYSELKETMKAIFTFWLTTNQLPS